MPTTGPNFPGAATGNTNTVGGGTASAWTTPTNIEANDGAFAVAGLSVATPISQDLRGGTFGFAIVSTDVINGVLLEVSAKATLGTASFVTVKLESSGAAIGVNRASGTLTTTLTVFSFGGSSDTWGASLTPAIVNDPSFFANVSFSETASSAVDVDFFRVTIFSTSAPLGKSQMFKVF